jgi:hypothetical protein
VFHKKGCQFGINAVCRPGFGNADHARGISPNERTEIFDIFGENDATLFDGQLVDLRIRKAVSMQVISNMFDIEMLVE